MLTLLMKLSKYSTRLEMWLKLNIIIQLLNLSSNAYSINETIEIFYKARNVDKVRH